MAELATEIRIGFTDGYRYIGIQPPLSDAEVSELRADASLVGGVEQVSLEPACTLVVSSASGRSFNEHTEKAYAVAEKLQASLRALRPEHRTVRFVPGMVAMSGPNSSPFNPNTSSDTLTQYA